MLAAINIHEKVNTSLAHFLFTVLLRNLYWTKPMQHALTQISQATLLMIGFPVLYFIRLFSTA